MDGWTLLFDLRETLHERSDSDWLNDQSSYTYLYEAAIELNARIAAITGTQSITSAAETAEYNLNPDFMGLYLRADNGEYYIKYYDTSNYTFINHKPYEDVVYDNLTTSATIPNYFSIKYATTQVSNVTGSASADGAVSNGEATLTDTSSSTKFEDIVAGDLVHNTTDSTHGIVVAKTSNTALVTAIFNSSGTAVGWSSAETYVIIPQPRFALICEPPLSTSGHTITVDYIKKPAPVFAPYRSYKFPTDCKRDLVEYAAGRYKYRERDPKFGDAFFRYFDRTTRVSSAVVSRARNRGDFQMNLRKRVH